MAIQIADGFQLRVAKPLDDRQNVETVAQLDPTYGYEGQIVYVKDIQQFYTCYKDENGSLAYKVMETGSSAPADLILDTEVRLDKTYSSSKIYQDIQQCLQDSKDFTLEELGKKIGASYEIVTSTDDMVSQDYLYLLNNGNGYDIYIVDVDNIPVVIGDTTIDLSNYYDKTEIDTKFEEELGVEVLNTTAQTVKGAINELLGASGDSAENVSYNNVDYPDITNVKTALDSIMAKIYYVDTAITSFTMTPSATTYEKGVSIPSLTFNWTYNKEVVTQTLTDCVLADVSVRTATYNSPLTTTKTFTLTASDGTKSATRSITISFRDKVYFGGAAQPDSYDSTFVLGLATANFATAKKGTYSMNVGAGQYGYLAIPTSFGAIDSVWIGGFEVTVDNCGVINFTNASGYTSSYAIYKTGQQGLGSITMEVK